MRKLRKFARNLANIKKCLITKRQNLQQHVKQREYFCENILMTCFFAKKIVKIFVFPKVFSKIYVIQEQSVRQLCWFCKKCTCFRKIFAKTEKSWIISTRYFVVRSKHLNQYLLCRHWWFSRSFKSFSLPYTSINFLFASLKLLTETLLRFPFSVIGQYFFLLPTSHWLQGKLTRINL